MWPAWIAGFCVGTACVGLWGIPRGILIGFMAAIIAGMGLALFEAFATPTAGQETYQRYPLFIILAGMMWSVNLGLGVLFGIPAGFALRKVISSIRE
jgi:hypothetical protein